MQVAAQSVQARVERANWWRDHLRDRCRRQPSGINYAKRVLVADVQAKVAEFYEISVGELLARTRGRKHDRPRQIAMFLARKLTSRSFVWIGKKFDGRDHSTVCHAFAQIEALMAVDKDLREDIETLARKITNAA